MSALFLRESTLVKLYQVDSTIHFITTDCKQKFRTFKLAIQHHIFSIVHLHCTGKIYLDRSACMPSCKLYMLKSSVDGVVKPSSKFYRSIGKHSNYLFFRSVFFGGYQVHLERASSPNEVSFFRVIFVSSHCSAEIKA